jgi:hypothetical protein
VLDRTSMCASSGCSRHDAILNRVCSVYTCFWFCIHLVCSAGGRIVYLYLQEYKVHGVHAKSLIENNLHAHLNLVSSHLCAGGKRVCVLHGVHAKSLLL